MPKKIVFLLLAVIMAGAGLFYYFSRVHTTRIDKILTNPGVYTGKEIGVEGEVIDRTAFFGSPKFYKLRDKSGELIVATEKALPQPKSIVRVKGRINDAFMLGERNLVVFVEISSEKRDRKK